MIQNTEKDIKDIKCFLLDMDGTIYLGNDLIEGASEFLELLGKDGKEFLFMTNNSSKNKRVYQEKLANLGLHIPGEKVFTSGEATRIYIKKENKGKKIFLLGNEFLQEEFLGDGFQLLSCDEVLREKPDFVVLGFDTTLTYEKIWRCCDLIKEGVTFLATHPDFVCPLAGGKSMPDTGAMIKMIEAATGILPKVIGKPNSLVVDSIIEKYGYSKEEIAMVGDRLYTDVQMGINSGITSILVLTGETTMESYGKQKDIVPDFIFSSVDEIRKKLED